MRVELIDTSRRCSEMGIDRNHRRLVHLAVGDGLFHQWPVGHQEYLGQPLLVEAQRGVLLGHAAIRVLGRGRSAPGGRGRTPADGSYRLLHPVHHGHGLQVAGGGVADLKRRTRIDGDIRIACAIDHHLAGSRVRRFLLRIITPFTTPSSTTTFSANV